MPYLLASTSFELRYCGRRKNFPISFYLLVLSIMTEKSKNTLVYFGTQTAGESDGIYRCLLNSDNGELTGVALAAKIGNPGFLAIHPSELYLYSTGDKLEWDERDAGSVNAFSRELKNGDLKLINRQSSVGSGPCHLSVDDEGKSLFVANYGGGSAAAFPVMSDGSLGEAKSFIQHKGRSGVHPTRQNQSHAHSIFLDLSNRFALVCDLGLDQVLVYKINPAMASLDPHDPPFARVAGGAGPRHLAFHQTRKWVYVLNEINSTVTVFSFDEEIGSLKEEQSISALPKDCNVESTCAEILLSPDGHFLYASNRGHDSLAIYSVNEENGRLTPVGHQSVLGKTPRNFAFDPSGKFVVVANQDTSDVYSFLYNENSGNLETTGYSIEIPNPICVRMIAVS